MPRTDRMPQSPTPDNKKPLVHEWDEGTRA